MEFVLQLSQPVSQPLPPPLEYRDQAIDIVRGGSSDETRIEVEDRVRVSSDISTVSTDLLPCSFKGDDTESADCMSSDAVRASEDVIGVCCLSISIPASDSTSFIASSNAAVSTSALVVSDTDGGVEDVQIEVQSSVSASVACVTAAERSLTDTQTLPTSNTATTTAATLSPATTPAPTINASNSATSTTNLSPSTTPTTARSNSATSTYTSVSASSAALAKLGERRGEERRGEERREGKSKGEK